MPDDRSLSPGRRSVAAEVRRLLGSVVAVALVLLLANLIPAGYLLGNLMPRVDRLRAAATELEALHASLVDEETGARGYLATGDPSFLAPYRGALPVVAGAPRQLAELLPSGTLHTQLLAMQQAERKWVDSWALQAVNPADGELDGRAGTGVLDQVARLTSFMAAGKVSFDAYRRAHDALESGIDRAINLASSEERGWLFASAALQALIALGSAAVAVVVQRRLTHRITEPVEQLVRAVRGIAAGDLTTELSLREAPQELAELGGHVTEMATALSEHEAELRRTQQELARRAQRLATVLRAAREVASSLSLADVLRSVGDAAVQLGSERVRIWLLTDDGKSLERVFDTAPQPADPGLPDRLTLGSGLVGRAVLLRRGLGPEQDETGGLLAVPLIANSRALGALECRTAGSRVASQEALGLIEVLAGHAAAALATAQVHARTRDLAATDPLTKLPNRRSFEADFRLATEPAQRQGRPLALISIDLDHFKELNDRSGHAAGDAALARTAQALLAAVRASDRVYRLGGEELAVLCPDTSAARAVTLADRLRAAVAAAGELGDSAVTASFGVAELPSHAGSAPALLAAADAALYAAKARGRNAVAVAQRGAATSPTPPAQLTPNQESMSSAEVN